MYISCRQDLVERECVKVNSYDVKIVIFDGDGEIVGFQPFREYISGKKDINIQRVMYGRQLFDILFDDLGIIRYDDNKKLMLGIILQSDINRTAMQILGRIAESIIVRNCHTDSTINQAYFSIARQKKAKKTTADKFMALGTGLNYTKEHYNKYYNPSDPQRDIVWINTENNELAIMKSQGSYSTTSAKIAGLQIKATRNGIQYVLPDILSGRYDVPIIYFDIENDYEKMIRKVYKQTHQNIEYNIIHPKEIDPSGYDEFLNYVDLIYALVRGKVSPEDLITGADKYDDQIMKNALLSTTLTNVDQPNRIII